MTEEDLRFIIQEESYRADVQVSDIQIDTANDKLTLTISCEHGSRSHMALGWSKETHEEMKRIIHHTFITWTSYGETNSE